MTTPASPSPQTGQDKFLTAIGGGFLLLILALMLNQCFGPGRCAAAKARLESAEAKASGRPNLRAYQEKNEAWDAKYEACRNSG
jgi:hypothetical protein